MLFRALDLSFLLRKVIKGQDVTVFTYGQSDSGKTYTVRGTEGMSTNESELKESEGLI